MLGERAAQSVLDVRTASEILLLAARCCITAHFMMTSPRWLDTLTKALSLPENKGQITYQLGTVDANGRPHVRIVGHREVLQPSGFPNLPILCATTDVRSPKVTELRANAYAELSWWISGSRDQYRISGPVRIISSLKSDAESASTSDETLALDKMREQGFDWEQKRRDAFDALGERWKATWCCPPPGSPMKSYEVASTWPQIVPKLGEAASDEDKRIHEEALGNFALLLIEAVEMDWVQVGEKPNRRTRFTRKGEEWVEQIVVP
ncbi:hypothetical protein BKA93DRAFT_768034 [Sparassis latifolia]